jgi:tetratricopeptide (TPR) repeat protein
MTAQPFRELAASGQAVRAGATPPLAPGFVARPETDPGLAAVLMPGGAAVLTASGGEAAKGPDWAGIRGKTQLAVQFAESLWHAGAVQLLAWVTATSRASILSGYATAAAAVAGTGTGGDDEAVAARFVSWLGETSRPWLLVLDDLADAADLEGLWPTGASGRVLVTTGVAAGLPPGATVLPVDTFSLREGMNYLIGQLAQDPNQRLGALDLVKELGCEPLALAQASAVIRESALSCQDYLGYFAHRREYMAEGQPVNSVPAAAVTWTFSFEHVGRLSADGRAQSVLALTALLDAHGVPGQVFTAPAVRGYLAVGPGGAATEAEARDALQLMARQGLLDIDAAGRWPTIRMSPAVQEAVRTLMPAELLSRATLAAAGALLEVWPEDDRGIPAADSLRSCATSLWQASGDVLWDGRCHPLLLRAGQSLDDAGLAGPAVAYWRELVSTCDRILGPGHPDTLATGDRLARACLAAGRAADAVPWFEWVLTRRVRALGPEHAETLETRRSLGRALMLAEQTDAAVAMLDRTVADYERVRGPEHPDTLAAREELATAYAAAGQAESASDLLQLTLEQLERGEGPRHPDTMSARHSLATAYLADDRVKDAVTQYKRALSDREAVLGADDPDTIATRVGLGHAYQASGQITSAMQLYEQASASYERVLGADDRNTLALRAELADAYYAAGRLLDATVLLQETLKRCERVLPAGDPLTQAVRTSMTELLGG